MLFRWCIRLLKSYEITLSQDELEPKTLTELAELCGTVAACASSSLVAVAKAHALRLEWVRCSHLRSRDDDVPPIIQVISAPRNSTRGISDLGRGGKFRPVAALLFRMVRCFIAELKKHSCFHGLLPRFAMTAKLTVMRTSLNAVRGSLSPYLSP